MLPDAGSTRLYVGRHLRIVPIFVPFGLGAGWVIGWAIIAEYLFAVGAIGIGWSAYMQGVIADFGIHLSSLWSKSPLVLGSQGFHRTGSLVNAPAVVIVGLTMLTPR